MQVYLWVLAMLIAYALGNINGALILSKWLHHDDVRSHGSGNAGLTNFFRTYGGIQSVLVIVIDVLKCVAACLIAAKLLPEHGQQAKMAAGLAAILGHSYPAVAGFRGGKGILCGVALIGCVDLRVMAVSLGIFILLVALTHYVSLGSVLGATAFPILYTFLHRDDWISCLLAFLAAGFVVARHHANISRLIKGTESKLTFHKKQE